MAKKKNNVADEVDKNVQSDNVDLQESDEIIQVEIPSVEEISTHTVIADNKLLVDKELFYRLMITSVKGIPHRGHAAVSKFAQLLGVTDSDEQVKVWRDAQEYIAGL